jgi:hypothetical protein
MRDFNPAYVGSGSKASDRRARRARGMSAAPPIAPEIVHCSDSTKSAKRRHMNSRCLLLVNERRGFGRSHWTGIAAEFGELLLQIRLRGDLAQVSTYFLDNGLWRVQRCHQDIPPGG